MPRARARGRNLSTHCANVTPEDCAPNVPPVGDGAEAGNEHAAAGQGIGQAPAPGLGQDLVPGGALVLLELHALGSAGLAIHLLTASGQDPALVSLLLAQFASR